LADGGLEVNAMTIETTISNAIGWAVSEPTHFALVIGMLVIIGSIKGAFSTILR
jgi:hypothetical protein